MNRFFAVSCFLLLLFSAIFYRLFDLCFFQREALLKIANKQHNVTIELEPQRGNILDRKGQFLATTVKSPSIYAIPRLISKKKKPQIVRELSEILDLDAGWIDRRLSRDKSFVWLKRKATQEEADAILELGNPNIAVQNEFKRF